VRSIEAKSMRLVVESATGPLIYTLQGWTPIESLPREILAQVSDAVIATDSEQRITYFNAAAERQYGVSASNVLGRTDRRSTKRDGSNQAPRQRR